MAVLIEGMEMPKSCYSCPLRKREGINIVCPVAQERFSVADVNILFYRLDSCPLVPVPPHGRLIDADVLCKTLHSLAENEYTPEVFANWIENHIDTVISASEEG